MATHLHNLEAGTYIEPHRETVAGLCERWLRDYASANVAPRTFERYAEIVHRHIVPALGSIRITSLRPMHIVTAEQRWLVEGRIDGRGGLSPRTVLHHHRLLREILQQAVKWQVLARDPASAVEPPRPARTDMNVLDRDQAARLLEQCDRAEFGTVIFMAIQTGLRLGELLGLRWSDVDLDHGAVRVQQTLQRLHGGEVLFGQPKTHRSRRAVSIAPSAVERLRRHRTEQLEQRLAVGAAYQHPELAFTDGLGGPVDERGLRRRFYGLLQAADLPRVRLHDLRHTMATLMPSLGAHPKIISERLGHATVGITLDTYSHVLPNLQAEAARQLDAWLTGSRKEVTQTGL